MHVLTKAGIVHRSAPGFPARGPCQIALGHGRVLALDLRLEIAVLDNVDVTATQDLARGVQAPIAMAAVAGVAGRGQRVQPRDDGLSSTAWNCRVELRTWQQNLSSTVNGTRKHCGTKSAIIQIMTFYGTSRCVASESQVGEHRCCGTDSNYPQLPAFHYYRMLLDRRYRPPSPPPPPFEDEVSCFHGKRQLSNSKLTNYPCGREMLRYCPATIPSSKAK